MYKFAIVDDKVIDKDRISRVIHDYIIDKNISIEETYYQDPLKFNFDIKYDAIFLDIDMPTQDGITLAKEINNRLNTKIIFMSNYSEYVFSSLDVRPFHFLRKENLATQTPHVLELLFNALNKENLFIKIHNKNTLQKINYLDIYYISMNDHICEVYTHDNHYQTWDTLILLHQQLSTHDFIKINRSQLANLKHIKKIENYKLILTNNISLTISLRLRAAVVKEYENYIMGII